MFFNFINHYVNYFTSTLFNKNKNYYKPTTDFLRTPLHYKNGRIIVQAFIAVNSSIASLHKACWCN